MKPISFDVEGKKLQKDANGVALSDIFDPMGLKID